VENTKKGTKLRKNTVVTRKAMIVVLYIWMAKRLLRLDEAVEVPTVDEDGAAMPDDDVAMPDDDVAMPVDDVAMPVDDAAMPDDDVAMPVDDVAMPVDDAAMPDVAAARSAAPAFVAPSLVPRVPAAPEFVATNWAVTPVAVLSSTTAFATISSWFVSVESTLLVSVSAESDCLSQLQDVADVKTVSH
jgi:hypothetical protein